MQVRKHAVELVQGLTGSPDGIAQLASKCDALVPPLLRLATADPAIARPALTSLVNLAQEPACQDKMIAMSTPARCMDYLKEGSAAGSEDLIIMLLSNLTAAEDGAAALLQLDKPNVEGLNL